MGAKRGQNNFRTHQQELVRKGEARLSTILQTIGRGERFKDWNAFVSRVAKAADLSPSTVKRNEVYRRVLVEFLAERPALLMTPRSGEPDPARELGMRIELENLKRDNARLRAFIELKELGEPSPKAVSAGIAGPDKRIAFEETATVLVRLLDHLSAKELGIVADPDNRTIRDDGEEGDAAVIAGPPRTTSFFDWLARHAALTRGGKA